MQFEWDNEKARINLAKHGVSFEEASTVFDDDFAKMFFDEIHSEEETREIIVGYSFKNRLLFVCFTEIGFGRVRIITARQPTKMERKDYEEKEEPEMKAEYRFDYSKARPNRFAEAYKKGTSIVNLESDVAEVFPNSEAVNEALRFLVRITEQHKSELTSK